MLIRLGSGAADHNDTARASLTRGEGFESQAAVLRHPHALLLALAFGRVAQHHHPLVLHIEMEVGRVGVRRLAFVVAASGRFDAITGEDDAGLFDFAGAGKGEGRPLLRDSERAGIDSLEGDAVRISQSHPGGELEGVEPLSIGARRLQSEGGEQLRSILRGQGFTLRSCAAAFQCVGREILDVLLDVRPGDVAGELRRRRHGQSSGGGIASQTERRERIRMIPGGH